MTDNLEAALAEASSGAIEADFSAAKDDFDNPEPGNYPVKVASAKADTSQAGNPVVKIQFTVTDGSYKGKLFASLNYTGKAAWKLRKFLKAWGYQVEGANFKLDPADLVGKEGIAVVSKDSAEFSSVDNLLPAPSTSSSNLE